MTSLDQIRTRFARNEGLPFADVLTERSIRHALAEHGVRHHCAGCVTGGGSTRAERP